MDFQVLINLGAGSVLALISYFVREYREEMRQTAAAITALRLKVAEEYVTHADLQEIRKALQRIEDKLDGKADK